MRITITALIALTIAHLSGCAVTQMPTQMPEPSEHNGISVTVTGTRVDSFLRLHRIYGGAVNNTGRDLSVCIITFSLYDDDGAKIGSAMATTQPLKQGEAWKFGAIPIGNYPSRIARVEVANVQRF